MADQEETSDKGRPAERGIAVRPGLAWLVFAVAALAAVIFVAVDAAGVTAGGDEWDYLHRLASEPLPDALFDAPPGKYLLAVPLLTVYLPLAELFGIGDYLPFRLVGMGLTVVAAGLLLALTRRRAGDGFALPAAILLLCFGAAGEVLAVPQRIPGLMAVCFGLGMLLALDREDRRWDAIAAVLGVLGVASHPLMLPFLAGAAVRTLGGPGPRLPRSALVVGPSLVVFAVWRLLAFDEASAVLEPGVSDILEFAWDQLVAIVAAVTGFFRGPFAQGIDFGSALAVAGTILLGAAVAYVLVTRRGITVGLAAALTILLVALVAPVLGQTIVFREPAADRYLYPGAIIVLLLVAELIAAGRPWPSPFRWAAVAGGVVWLFSSIPSNVLNLHAEADAAVAAGETLRAELGAIELARLEPGSKAEAAASAEATPEAVTALTFHGDAPPEELAFAVIAGAPAYFDIADEFGSPALDPGELAGASAAQRAQADRLLVLTLPVEGVPAEGSAPAAAGKASPLPAGETEVATGECVRVPASPESLPDPPLPPPPNAGPALAAITVPPGAAWIDWGGEEAMGVRVGRFGDAASQTIALPGTPQTRIALPEAGVDAPWMLALYTGTEATVCAE
ncbi:MAG: hypothetical protein M3Y34_05930 [Actinomycetota bacterium]|nr:hypothetical protein [Actinomycetota bacterium]